MTTQEQPSANKAEENQPVQERVRLYLGTGNGKTTATFWTFAACSQPWQECYARVL